ncbi:hypothetical protein OS493_037066 [Desmophyllum pertusum]|uniref:ShKT domain-containing protein n=1 Tax=Desmophyllum pertusum TaxID=174260 RepID=A0A9W9ZI51_9CNID|nr:hypothetical protein OS493_037066 [Desmophyllum pertusum]
MMTLLINFLPEIENDSTKYERSADCSDTWGSECQQSYAGMCHYSPINVMCKRTCGLC